ncbi:MAG: aldolase [Firmicutes bacterium]|nr:aldolase [Bacillota bacterium]
MLEELKQQVVKYALSADRSGLCKHRAGNFSARDPQTGYVCITPTGVDREELSYHDICVIDLDANVIEAETGLRPTSESLMHLAAYKSRTDIHAVAHTHSRYATSFAVLKKEIPAIVYEVAGLGCKKGYIPLAPYGRPGTPELAQSVVEPLQIADVALMESHGVIAVDKELKEALLKAHYVEELAEIYYRTLMLNGGKEPHTVPLEELQQWEYPKEIKLLKK